VRRRQHGRNFEDSRIARQRLAGEHIQCRIPRPPLAQRGLQCSFLDQLRPARVHEQRVALHARQVIGLDDAARGIVQPQMQAHHVGLLEECLPRRRGRPTVGGRGSPALVAAPHHHLHAERLRIARDQVPDLAIAPDAQRATLEHAAQAVEFGVDGCRLPEPILQIVGIGHDLAAGRHDQCPRQLGRRDGRTDAFRDRDAVFRRGRHVDVAGYLARLRNQLQVRQPGQQCARKCGAFADQDEGVEGCQADRQLAQAAGRVIEHFDVVALQQTEAFEAAGGVLIIVENRNFHGC